MLILSMSLTTFVLRRCGIKQWSWALSTGFVVYISVLGGICFVGGLSQGAAAAQSELFWVLPEILAFPAVYFTQQFANGGEVSIVISTAAAGALQYWIIGWLYDRLKK
jgi:hypothetical protein